jgi:hypothetical protein
MINFEFLIPGVVRVDSPVIAKTFVIVKTFSSYSANFLHAAKSLRDHDNAAGRPTLSDATRTGSCTTSPSTKWHRVMGAGTARR